MTGNELLDSVLPRVSKFKETSGISVLDAINLVIEIFFDRLHQRKSDIARAQFTGVTIDGEFNELPDDFRGFAGPVRLEDSDGEKIDLIELPYGEETLEGSEPIYWRLSGPFNLQIIPAAEEDYTLEGFYYSIPDKLVVMTGNIPWEGILDSRIADAVVAIVSVGTVMAVSSDVREKIGDICERLITNRTYHPRTNKLWL